MRMVSFLVLVVTASTAYSESDGPQSPTPQEVESLRRQIEAETSSRAEIFTEYRDRSGDLNSHLTAFRYGLQGEIRSGQTTFIGRVARTSYDTTQSILSETGTNVTVGVAEKFSDRVDGRFEGGATHFSTNTTTVNGLGRLNWKPSEKGRLSVTISRSNVEESVLTATGIRPVVGPFAKELVGPILENLAGANGSYRISGHFDLFGEGALGNRTGDHSASDAFRRAGGGVGWNVVAVGEDQPLSLFRLSGSAYYFGYDDNRFGFGGVSLLNRFYKPVPITALGSDGLPTVPSAAGPGTGGYFSPSSFESFAGRLDLRGRPDPSFEYRVAAFVGVQNYTDSSNKAVAGVSGDLTFRSGRFSLPLSFAWDNVAPFHQFWVSARLVARF